jgi:hypothetical protein
MNSRFVTGIVLLLIILATPVRAQVVAPSPGTDHPLRQSLFGLGIFGGPAGGLGISFRHHLPSIFSYQITGGIINVDDKLKYDVGLEAQFDLVRGPQGRFYAAGASSYFFSGKNGINEIEGPGRVGLGVGYELFIGGGFHATGELLFTYFTDNTVLPLPQLGIFYYFY